ncbi:MAG: lysozyme inhibitor LprI family protein [Sphingomonadales bacterium]
MRGLIILAALASLLAAVAASAQQGAAGRDLQAARQQAFDAIAVWDSEPSAEDQQQWRADLDAVLQLWTRFRDTRCDARLIGYERRLYPESAQAEASRCADRFTRTIAADLRRRYDAPGHKAARPSLDPAVDGSLHYPVDPEKVDCRPPPPADCDYCGINACWEIKLKRDDNDLNAEWRRALAGIGGKSSLGAAARADWAALLRESQRAWLALRDAECDLEGWETPNRFAHSIYSLQRAPCLHAETRARIEALRAGYRSPSPARGRAR